MNTTTCSWFTHPFLPNNGIFTTEEVSFSHRCRNPDRLNTFSCFEYICFLPIGDVSPGLLAGILQILLWRKKKTKQKKPHIFIWTCDSAWLNNWCKAGVICCETLLSGDSLVLKSLSGYSCEKASLVHHHAVFVTRNEHFMLNITPDETWPSLRRNSKLKYLTSASWMFIVMETRQTRCINMCHFSVEVLKCVHVSPSVALGLGCTLLLLLTRSAQTEAAV